MVPKKNEKEMIRLELTEAERQLFKTFEMRDSDDERSSSDDDLQKLESLQLAKRLRQKDVKKRKHHVGLNFTSFVRNKGLMWDLKCKYFDVSQKDTENEFEPLKLKAEFLRKKHQKKKFDRLTFNEFLQMHVDRAQYNDQSGKHRHFYID